ncbi:MAG: isochorismatase [Acidobacteria bacterium]|nr:isochorismatase [Acidobacteriota bacterium]
MLKLREPYEPRPIRFLEEWQDTGWRMKIYGIAYRRPTPRAELVETAKRIAWQCLPFPPDEDGRYGVGFIGVHDGRGANFVFVDWWADENELHHHVFAAPSEELKDLPEITATGLSVCVWDLRVQCFEREAWLEAVLANSRGADLADYMRRRLNEDA